MHFKVAGLMPFGSIWLICVLGKCNPWSLRKDFVEKALVVDTYNIYIYRQKMLEKVKFHLDLDGQIDVARTCSKAPVGVHHHRAQSSLIWKSQIELLASLGWTSEALNLGKE